MSKTETKLPVDPAMTCAATRDRAIEDLRKFLDYRLRQDKKQLRVASAFQRNEGVDVEVTYWATRIPLLEAAIKSLPNVLGDGSPDTNTQPTR